MDLRHKSVEAIVKFNELGNITPLRVRMEDEQQNRITINVDTIIYIKENIYAGIETIDYGCKVLIDDREQMIELRYYIMAHKWTISKLLY